MTLFGANVHVWSNFEASVAYIAATPGMGVVRWDVTVGTPVASVVASYDLVAKYKLQSVIVLTQQIADGTALCAYLKSLGLALGTRQPHAVEILNEPNAVGYGTPVAAATYGQILYTAQNCGSGLKTLMMGGLALNDQAYLAATQLPKAAYLTAYSSAHLYTAGGPPTAYVGPLAPDDTDSAHSGLFSFIAGIDQMYAALGKRVVIGEWGWETGSMPESQRCSFMRAAVSIVRARASKVEALILEEIGSGDGVAADYSHTAAWAAFAEAVTAP